MNKEQILKRLAEPEIPFIEKLRLAANLEIDLWEDRTPPNLSALEFKKLLGHIPASVSVTWTTRESTSGVYGLTGDDDVFKFEFKAKFLGYQNTYFVKGYFYDKGNCHGVCLQSFRLESREKIRFVRLVR